MAVKVNVVKGGNTTFTAIAPASDAKTEYLQEDGIKNAKPLSNSGAAKTYFDYDNGVSPSFVGYWVIETPENIFNQASDATV